MKISEIYTKYQIPPNLQEHMYRVTALAKLICDNWTGEDKLDVDVILQACLLHDMGNIIKFDFDNFPQLLGEEQKNIEYWKKVKREMIKRYGEDEDMATVQICKELRVQENVLFLIENWGFKNFTRIAESDNWEWKIAVYADHRISPQGVVSLKQNLENKQKRYKLNRPNASHISDKSQNLYDSAIEVENDLQKNISVKLDSIKTEDLDKTSLQIQANVNISNSHASNT